MKTLHKNIEGFIMGRTMKPYAKRRLAKQPVGTVLIITAYNGAEIFKKTLKTVRKLKKK